ncbi:L-threonylcarbamoyladenylate synthase [Prochlorothrix hollandica]|uniref:Translation factor SUA5 n=1 Tax=Prochlorothrix hollandica PCC 9006 = CALU 1027 TaxID=317619 RepID=A0A0M2PZJ6_PROHO|nr:L-threonylcarbamoyladenylate synthase [Prochlorothrix hollandica]KKJ01585.1 translation factor SUA5 [Prochlorothrix hollandica PCC 9006 = CALU 1027]
MAKFYELHPTNPQFRRIEAIRDALRRGAIMLYPTDTVYAIGCDLTAKSAVDRVRQIKQLSNDKPLTFLCPSLSNVAQYAHVTDANYRLLKSLVPGPYTFLLPATKLVPKVVMNPKRKTAGIRVPQSPVCQELLEALDNPIISTSAHMPELSAKGGRYRDSTYQVNPAELFDQLESVVDIIVAIEDLALGNDEPRVLSSNPDYQVSTILDLTTPEPTVVRKGLGWAALRDWDLAESA